MTMVRVKDLNKSFRENGDPLKVLKNINFEIDTGEVVSIVGPSGCGKTTLMNIIAGLEAPSSGEVSIDGKSVQGIPEDIGLVSQQYEKTLLPWKTVWKNIELPLQIKDYPKKKRKQLVEESIHLIGLEGFEQSKPYQLSGGMQQRVAFARGLVYQPRLLLLDEPFGAVDAQTREILQEDVLKILKTEGQTALVVTHDVRESVFLGDRVIVLSDRPGTIAEIVEVNLPEPRHEHRVRATSEFVDMTEFVWNVIRQEESSLRE